MPVKKTEREEAALAAEQAMDKWSKSVFRLHNQGKLDKVMAKYDVPNIRRLPMGKEMGDYFMNRNIENARTDKTVSMDPDESNFLLRDSLNIPIQKTYELARSTFSPEFVKTMERISPQVGDSVSEKLNAAIEFRISSKLKKFVNNNPRITGIIRELAEQNARDKEQIAMNEESLKNSLYNNLMSDELAEYAGFLKSAIGSKKIKAKESLFSPLVHSYKRVNDWLQMQTGVKGQIGEMSGVFRPGEDFDTEEAKGVLFDKDSQKSLLQERLSKVGSTFNKWRAAKKANTEYQFDPSDMD